MSVVVVLDVEAVEVEVLDVVVESSSSSQPVKLKTLHKQSVGTSARVTKRCMAIFLVAVIEMSKETYYAINHAKNDMIKIN
jgi:hypothetical protein